MNIVVEWQVILLHIHILVSNLSLLYIHILGSNLSLEISH